MKVIIIPLFRLLSVVIGVPFSLSMLCLCWVLVLVWDFRLMPYKEFYCNEGSNAVKIGGKRNLRHDDNIGQTIKRFWKFDYY
jgi:hypothetical protein